MAENSVISQRFCRTATILFFGKRNRCIPANCTSARRMEATKRGDGSPDAPFATINAAAAIAEAGTRVLIHQGTYRECVRPAFGGEDARAHGRL